MQPHSSYYRMGGLILAIAGILGALGAILHGPQPGSLDALAEAGMGMWNASHILIALAGVVVVAGSIFLGRSFTGGSAEGWGVFAMSAGVLAGICTLAVGVIETIGFGGLLAASDGASAVAAEHAFVAATFIMSAFAGAGFLLFFGTVGTFGIAMLQEASWPTWLAWAGIVIGYGLFILDLINVDLPGAYTEIVLTDLWLIAAGTLFMNMGREVEAPAPAPEPAAL